MQCNVDPNWLQDFDTALKRYFLIDHAEAGMGETELARYADLRPHDAALQYGEDYDLQRVDIDWLSPTQRRFTRQCLPPFEGVTAAGG